MIQPLQVGFSAGFLQRGLSHIRRGRRETKHPHPTRSSGHPHNENNLGTTFRIIARRGIKPIDERLLKSFLQDFNRSEHAYRTVFGREEKHQVFTVSYEITGPQHNILLFTVKMNPNLTSWVRLEDQKYQAQAIAHSEEYLIPVVIAELPEVLTSNLGLQEKQAQAREVIENRLASRRPVLV